MRGSLPLDLEEAVTQEMQSRSAEALLSLAFASFALLAAQDLTQVVLSCPLGTQHVELEEVQREQSRQTQT